MHTSITRMCCGAAKNCTRKLGQVLNSFLSCLSGFYCLLCSFAAVLLGIAKLPHSLGGPVGTLLLEQVGLLQSQTRRVV